MFWSLPKDSENLMGFLSLRCSGLWMTLLCGKDPDFLRCNWYYVSVFDLSIEQSFFVSVVRPIALNLSDGSVAIFVCFRRQAYSRFH